MRKPLYKFLAIVFLGLFLLLGNPFSILAECDSVCQLGKQIEEYEREIVRLQGQANTLSNQIAQFNAQIQLTQLQINQTEEKINLLGGRIDQLEVSLTSLSEAFFSRVIETYKMSRFGETVYFLASAKDLSEAVLRFNYLRRIQQADQELISRLQTAQTAYKTEKSDLEVLQGELENHNKVLGAQKEAKADLLAVTRNDERRYQQLLAQARAEYEAIQGIIAGKGQETEIGKISAGQRIASIIQGSSCNSLGTHIHFTIRKGDKTTDNPFNYLKGGIDYENCSGSSCGNSDGDPFNPSGSWDWPIQAKIRFSQGYGYTWAIQNDPIIKQYYTFHNGIDINSESSTEVKAVKSGTLFRGSYVGYNGCTLRYVRVDHDDSDLDTLYLHVNY